MNWREGIMRLLRLRSFETRPDDEAAEQDKIQRAKTRLKYLDIQADIIERRGKSHVEPR